MSELVSIIIPIYNAEENIKKCLDSIIKQDYLNLEILCINDGSKDNSKKIIDTYQKKDKRIVVINKENSGVSDTRNLGIRLAKGNYIMFIDADDYISNDYIKVLMDVVKKNNSEYVISGYTEISNNTKKEKSIYKKENQVFDISYPKQIGNLLETFEINPCWKQLISKRVIYKNNIEFDKNIKYGEDMLFSLECYIASKKTTYVKNYGYFYIINDSGAMRKKDIKSLEKRFSDNKLTTEIITRKYNIDTENIKKIYFKTLFVFNKISTAVINAQNNFITFRKIVSNQRKKYNDIFKKYNVTSCGTLKQKLWIFLLKYRIYFIYYILKKCKRKRI